MTGRYPRFEDFNLDGLDIDEAVWAETLRDRSRRPRAPSGFGDKLPRRHHRAAGPRARRREAGLIRADLRASPGTPGLAAQSRLVHFYVKTDRIAVRDDGDGYTETAFDRARSPCPTT